MSVNKKQIALLAILGWLFLIIFFMILSAYFDLEIYFGFGFLGILFMVQLLDQSFVKPRYIRNLHYIVVAGILLFVAIIVQKLLEVF